MLQDSSDDALVKQALEGESRAFEALVHRHFEMVFAVGLSHLRDPELADELAREVFVRAYLNLASVKLSRYLPAWLCRVTRNLAIDWIRRGQTASKLVPMIPLEDLPDEVPDQRARSAREQHSIREERELLDRALSRLTPPDREVVLLHFLQGLSKSEIARRLELHPSSVGRQLDRVLGMLREDLGPSMGRETAASLKPAPARAARAALVGGALAGMSCAGKTAVAAAAMAEGGLAAVAASAATTGGGGLAGKITTMILTGGLVMNKIQISIITVCLLLLLGSVAVSRNWFAGNGAGQAPPVAQRLAEVSAATTDGDRRDNPRPGGAGAARGRRAETLLAAHALPAG